jgi:shikimate kinase
MTEIQKLFLIGPMGSGKSAVGRRLATQLGLSFYDSDDEIEARTGVDISYIFEKEGESGFRKRESAVIAELAKLNGIVLATGGGAAEDPDTRHLLGANGTVIYLYTGVEEQQRRTSKSRNRPLLNEGDPAEVLERLMQLRDPQFREIADLIVITDGRQVAAVTKEIQKKLAAEPAGDVPGS